MSPQKRIAVNVGGGFVPGLNAVVAGVVRAAGELGWNVVGIRDGFDGLLFPERYPDGGLVPLTAEAGDILGNRYAHQSVLKPAGCASWNPWWDVGPGEVGETAADGRGIRDRNPL